MNTGDLIERNIKGKLLLFLSPLVLLTSMVWFTSDFIAQKLAYLFQIYLSLTLCFISGFLWSQSGLFKAANLRYLGSIILLVYKVRLYKVTYKITRLYGDKLHIPTTRCHFNKISSSIF